MIAKEKFAPLFSLYYLRHLNYRRITTSNLSSIIFSIVNLKRLFDKSKRITGQTSTILKKTEWSKTGENVTNIGTPADNYNTSIISPVINYFRSLQTKSLKTKGKVTRTVPRLMSKNKTVKMKAFSLKRSSHDIFFHS